MPYKLQKTEDGYFVTKPDGERKNKKPLPRSKAVAYMRALYAAEKRTMAKDGEPEGEYKSDDYRGVILGVAKKHLKKNHMGENNIFVFKQANGQSRWILYSTNAYKDRDNEIVSTAALEADVARADKEGNYGPLRWWHVGKPDPFLKLPGPGIDFGRCDYNAMHGRILIESGTFDNEAIAESVKNKAKDLQVSIGFFHPQSEPIGGVFSNIRRFERSLLPRGRASNPWTSMLVVQKEGGTMLKEKIQALKVLLGGDDELVQSVLEKAEQTQKAAEEAGIEFKGEDPQPETPETPATEKAEVVDLTELADQETLEELADEVSEADLEPVIGDMTPEEFSGMMAEALAKALEPHVKEISKLKISYSQKDDEVVSLKEALTLQAQTINALKTQLDELTGSQPRAATKGYRASQAEETVVKSTSRVAGQKPTVDAGFLDFAIGQKP